MIFVQVATTIGLLICSSLGPGLLVVRTLRWRPLETLCGSVALSFFLLYLTAFTIYVLNLSPAWAFVPTAAAAVATVICVGDLRRLWRSRAARSAMLAFLALFSWLLVLLLVARGYSGGRWYGDWYEHFHRARFFAEHLPLDTKFLNAFIVPARPPMMNVLAASMFWQVAPSFEVLQVVFSYLNALVILPCALLAPSLVARTRNRAWLIAGLLALNPMFVQNSTYTWTKLFAAFYALTALGLYISASRKNDPVRMVAASTCFAIGMLVHYSVAPIILFVAAHYLFVLSRHRKLRWQELTAATVAGAAVFATWIAWSLSAYGWHDTFASNTTVLSSQELTWSQNASKVAQNMYYALVPAVVRGGIEKDEFYDRNTPPQGPAYVRDWCFAIYQPSFPAAIGLGGMMLAGWLLMTHCVRPRDGSWQHRRGFWLLLVLVVTVVGIAVHGDLDYLGVAHICLQPLVLLGVTWAAVGWPHVSRWWRGIALAALFIDASLGVLLHFYILQTNHEVVRVGDQVTVSHAEVGMSAINNALLKGDFNVTFLGDHAADYTGILLSVMIAGVLAICLGLLFLGERRAPVFVSVPAQQGRSAKRKKSFQKQRKRSR